MESQQNPEIPDLFSYQFVNQKFFVFHSYTILEETEKNPRVVSRSALQHVTFLRKCKNKIGYFVEKKDIIKEGVFVTKLSSNAEISVGRIVWVKRKCRFKNVFYLLEDFLLPDQNTIT